MIYLNLKLLLINIRILISRMKLKVIVVWILRLVSKSLRCRHQVSFCILKVRIHRRIDFYNVVSRLIDIES